MSFMGRVTAARTAPQAFGAARLALLLAGFGLLIALRLPAAWTEGRFLDEEATVFLAYAWNFPAGEALFRAFGGYWNIAANVSTLLLAQAVKAGAIGLAEAPYATMIIGLLFQLAPVLLLLTGRASWLEQPVTRLVAALLVVLAPGTEEVFLNVMHIQFHLALCVAIILSLDPPEGRAAKAGYGAALFVAPLCGPGAIVFLPLFVLRTIADRSRERLVQTLLLGTGAAIQLLLFYSASTARGAPLEPDVLGAGMFVRLVVLPLAGPLLSALFGFEVMALEARSSILVPLMALTTVGLFLLLARWTLSRRDSARWLLAASLLIALVSFGLGAANRSDRAAAFVLSGMTGPRYNYLPVVLLALTLLALAQRSGRLGPRCAKVMLAAYLAMGALFYQLGLPDYTKGPSWAAEVKRWEADPEHRLAVWPQPYRADLSGRPFRCAPAVAARGDPSEPRYCESGWVAAFYRPKR